MRQDWWWRVGLLEAPLRMSRAEPTWFDLVVSVGFALWLGYAWLQGW